MSRFRTRRSTALHTVQSAATNAGVAAFVTAKRHALSRATVAPKSDRTVCVAQTATGDMIRGTAPLLALDTHGQKPSQRASLLKLLKLLKLCTKEHHD